MSDDPEILQADVGGQVSVTVPNWSVAGFGWEPEFDPLRLRMAGRINEAPNRTSFRFDVLATEADLRLVLRRSGKKVRETRRFVVRTPHRA